MLAVLVLVLSLLLVLKLGLRRIAIRCAQIDLLIIHDDQGHWGRHAIGPAAVAVAIATLEEFALLCRHCAVSRTVAALCYVVSTCVTRSRLLTQQVMLLPAA